MGCRWRRSRTRRQAARGAQGVRRTRSFETPHLLVLNQSDRLTAEIRADLARRFPDAIFTSALTGEGLDDLKERIFQLLDESAETIELELDATDEDTGKLMAQLARHGRILEQKYTAPEDNGARPVLNVRALLARQWFELTGIDEDAVR